MAKRDIGKLYDDYMEVVVEFRDLAFAAFVENLRWTHPDMNNMDEVEVFNTAHRFPQFDEIYSCYDLYDLQCMIEDYTNANDELMMKKLEKDIEPIEF